MILEPSQCVAAAPGPVPEQPSPIEHTHLDGHSVITMVEAALARLVGHEIDHLLSGAAVMKSPVSAGQTSAACR
ncbi:hypothetical protein [Nonomuraea sp. NPDC049141]|uniref:hypothetical protein n=1 Tax=unclassified Nonomuraea TaxID=2593643 RepID=UPI0033F2A6C8